MDNTVNAFQLQGILTGMFLAHKHRTMAARDLTICILGPPGTGKSQIPHQVAQQIGLPITQDDASIRTPEDYAGLPFRSKTIDTEAEFLPFNHMADWCRDLGPRIVVIEEVPQATPAVQAALMQVLEARQLGSLKIDDGVLFIITGNRAQDNAAAGNLLSTIISRCATTLTLTPSVLPFIAWGARNNIHEFILSFVACNPDMLTTFDPNRRFEPFACPRTYAKASNLLRLGLDGTCENAALAGCLGDKASTKLSSALLLLRSNRMPSIMAILAGKQTIKINIKNANDLAIAYAVASGLAAQCDKTNVHKATDYLANCVNITDEVLASFVSQTLYRLPECNQDDTFKELASRLNIKVNSSPQSEYAMDTISAVEKA